MSRTRYEPVPQRDEVINLDSLAAAAGYNYNTGIPNSIPSSVAPSNSGDGPRSSSQYHAPSIRSIPVSPPPSFHTHSSPGTPRPTRSLVAPSEYAAELWGVAPSTSAPTEICSGSEALATISQLKQRVERLEESIGRLLLEKELEEPESYKGGNCCMYFTDASKNMERGMAASGNNCCIYFRSSKDDQHSWDMQKEKLRFAAAITTVFLFGMTVVLVTLLKATAHTKVPNEG